MPNLGHDHCPGHAVVTEKLEPIAENVWLLRYPLKLVGMPIGRNVTIIRLTTGELLVHSTAPFTAEDVALIGQLGKPAWLLDATLFHDTFAPQGRRAFPTLPYFAPDGFAKGTKLETLPLNRRLPTAWQREIEVLRLEGMPKVQEHVVFHRPSKTLIVADMVFNWLPSSSLYVNFMRRKIMGLTQFPGMSRFFKLSIKDAAAFKKSVNTMMSWDFDRLIVAHDQVVATGAKTKMAKALDERGF